ncbi:MAG: dephospho-CoA kinase [Opitutales bacterium]
MKIALSGAMGAGKTTAINIFKKFDIKVVNADLYCKELLFNNEEVKSQVKLLLGEEVYDRDNLPILQNIAQKVFSSSELLAKYELIFHKPFEEFIAQKVPKEEIIVYEIPLLFEKKLEKNFDLCLSLFCSEAIRRTRLYSRNMCEEDIIKRDSFQLPPEKKVQLADIVLFNETSEAFLEAQIKNFFDKIKCKTI